jgi:hypothetical protein
MKTRLMILAISIVLILVSSCMTFGPVTSMYGARELPADPDFIIGTPQEQSVYLTQVPENRKQWVVVMNYDTGDRIIQEAQTNGEPISAEEIERLEGTDFIHFTSQLLSVERAIRRNHITTVTSLVSGTVHYHGEPTVGYVRLDSVSNTNTYNLRRYERSYSVQFPQIPPEEFPIQVVFSNPTTDNDVLYIVYRLQEGFGEYSFANLPVPTKSDLETLEAIELNDYLTRFRIPYRLLLSTGEHGELIQIMKYENSDIEIPLSTGGILPQANLRVINAYREGPTFPVFLYAGIAHLPDTRPRSAP